MRARPKVRRRSGGSCPGPLIVDALGSRGLVGRPSFRRQERSIGGVPSCDQPRHELVRGAGLHQALRTEELTHTTQRPVVPPNAQPAARGRACRSLQGGGRASRSSTSERFDSDCVRRILRPGQFTHWNGALGAHGAVRPRSNRPPELAAICACATRRCGGRLFRPARATSRRRTTRHPH